MDYLEYYLGKYTIKVPTNVICTVTDDGNTITFINKFDFNYELLCIAELKDNKLIFNNLFGTKYKYNDCIFTLIVDEEV